MKNEVYYWIALLAVIIAVALYIRYYYTPGISISLSFENTTNIYYKYQKASLNLTVINKGGPIKDFDVGVFINGNLSSVYNITLGSGKSTLVELSHSFQNTGTYNITVVGDPADLYNVPDRAAAGAEITINVLNPLRANPAGLLPRNATDEYTSNMTVLGYGAASFLSNNFDIGQTAISNMSGLNSFLYPFLNFTNSYIGNMSSAGAEYPDGKAYSLWINGYLDPSIISAVGRASGLNVSSEYVNGTNVTSIELNKNTTFCGWYSQGWLKTLSYQGNMSCLSLLESNNLGITVRPVQISIPYINGTTLLANFSYSSESSQRFGELSLAEGDSFIYSTIWKNGIGNSTCYGIVSKVKNVSYCDKYVTIANALLIRTTAYIGSYNATVLSLTNQSDVLNQSLINIGIINTFNLTGGSLAFISGLQNGCTFNATFYCANPVFKNGNLSFTINNELNTSIRLKGLACFGNGGPIYTTFNSVIRNGGSLNLTTQCYNNGTPIAASNTVLLPLSLDLNLALNYSIGNSTYKTGGRAFIV